MGELLRNVEVRGSTMGSLAEFKEAVRFVSDTKLDPVVHTVLRGLGQLDKGFDIMGKGEQFGKIVATVDGRSKL